MNNNKLISITHHYFKSAGEHSTFRISYLLFIYLIINNCKVKLFYFSRSNYRSHLSVPALILDVILGTAPTQLLPQTMIHFLLADSHQEYQKSLKCIQGWFCQIHIKFIHREKVWDIQDDLSIADYWFTNPERAILNSNGSAYKLPDPENPFVNVF